MNMSDLMGSLCGLTFSTYMPEVVGRCDGDGLLHIVAGVKRLLMKLKSREIYSGTWPQLSQ